MTKQKSKGSTLPRVDIFRRAIDHVSGLTCVEMSIVKNFQGSLNYGHQLKKDERIFGKLRSEKT